MNKAVVSNLPPRIAEPGKGSIPLSLLRPSGLPDRLAVRYINVLIII
jgi:hypothetical protein